MKKVLTLVLCLVLVVCCFTACGSNEKIDYPKVQSPDILVAMSHEALLKYIVDLKDNGILIDINDKNKLVQSMKYMHSNIDRYDKESIAKDIEERFCFKSVANKIIEVYKNVINKSIY